MVYLDVVVSISKASLWILVFAVALGKFRLHVATVLVDTFVRAFGVSALPTNTCIFRICAVRHLGECEGLQRALQEQQVRINDACGLLRARVAENYGRPRCPALHRDRGASLGHVLLDGRWSAEARLFVSAFRQRPIDT